MDGGMEVIRVDRLLVCTMVDAVVTAFEAISNMVESRCINCWSDIIINSDTLVPETGSSTDT